MFINKAERSCVRIATIALATAAVLTTAAVASPYSDINRAAKSGPINVIPLRGRISMLTGSGGNITALPGPRGFLLVYTGIGLSRSMIVRALRSIKPGPIRLAISTRWHWDHTDGNAWVHATGAGIMADRTKIARLKQTIRVEGTTVTLRLPSSGG